MAQPWKHPSSGIFYFRREVPEGIRSLIGKREWKVSLRTRNPSEMRPRYAAAALQCAEAFAAAQEQLQGRTRLVASDAPKLADRWAESVLAGWETENSSIDEFLAHYSDGRRAPAYHEIGIESSDDAYRVVEPHLKATLGELGLPLPERSDPVWTVVVNEFGRTWTRLCDFAYMRHRGDWRAAPSLPAVSVPLACESRASIASTIRLSQVFEKWAEDKRQTDPGSGKTINEFGMTVRRFVELYGDVEVRSISREQVGDFRLALGKIPTKGHGIRGLSAPQAIARAEAEGLPTPSLPTIRKQLRGLSAVLNFGVQRLQALTEEPIAASGMLRALAKAARRAETRTREDKSYERAELRRIFSSPLFRGHWRPKKADYGQALYWLPLLLAYTGARREELAQLFADDVCCCSDSSIWYLSIRPVGGNSVKQANSRRRVPLHPDLIELGFLRYVDGLPKAGRLFPELKAHSSNGFGDAVGKAWGNYLTKEVGLNSAADPAHGLRHTFKSLCREAYIETAVVDWITGHSDSSVGASYGVQPLQRMAEELKKFPSIARMAGLLPD